MHRTCAGCQSQTCTGDPRPRLREPALNSSSTAGQFDLLPLWSSCSKWLAVLLSPPQLLETGSGQRIELSQFILPGDSDAGVFTHLCRGVAAAHVQVAFQVRMTPWHAWAHFLGNSE